MQRLAANVRSGLSFQEAQVKERAFIWIRCHAVFHILGRERSQISAKYTRRARLGGHATRGEHRKL